MSKSDISIVTVCCENCSRAFRTLLWIAETTAPSCPRCHRGMTISEVGGVEQLSKPISSCK